MRVLTACVLVLAGSLASCHEAALVTFKFGKDCDLIAVAGSTSDELMVVRGHIVRITNESGRYVSITVSDAAILGGRRSLRLTPGETVFVRVNTDAAKDWTITWKCWRIEDDGPVDDGDGGSPGKTEDTPPN